jgi:hypothetical protein
MDITAFLFWPLWPIILCSFGILYFIDKVVLGHVDKSPRWFLVHFFGNMVITGYALPDVLHALQYPLEALGGSYAIEPTIIAIILHIYHLLFYTDVSWDDIVHHFGFVATLGSVALVWSWGPASNMMLFFMCGLPGGLDYLLLALVKLKFINSITEKWINTYINLYIRSPGILLTAFLLFVNMFAVHGIPIYIVCGTLGLMCFNAQYYLGRVIFSFGKNSAPTVLKDTD